MVNIANLDVTPIAETGSRLLSDLMRLDDWSAEGEDVMEFAGRSCYQSFHKPNPATRANKDYLAHIIESGHGSVLEHAQVTFYIEGVSRALTHELIRHRHLSYSQMSQRFVDESSLSIVVPPAFEDDPEAVEILKKQANKAVKKYNALVERLESQGYKRKAAREAARAVLPNMTETKIVVTGNCRAWRDFLYKRLDPSADMEIQRLARELLKQLTMIYPAVFADIAEKEGI